MGVDPPDEMCTCSLARIIVTVTDTSRQHMACKTAQHMSEHNRSLKVPVHQFGLEDSWVAVFLDREI
jgi:hypothetical protein